MIEDDYEQVLKVIIDCLKRKRTIFIAGNGGSSSQASHFSAELIGKGLRCIAFNDPVVITALSNDLGYDHVFSSYLIALGQEGDVFIGVSTSGRSQNIFNAITTARNFKIKSILLVGRKDSPCGNVADLSLFSFSDNTQISQEDHLSILHRLYLDVQSYCSK